MNAATMLNPHLTDTEWPSYGLESLERYPCCNGSGQQLLHAELGDRKFHCVAGSWYMVRCADCWCRVSAKTSFSSQSCHTLTDPFLFNPYTD